MTVLEICPTSNDMANEAFELIEPVVTDTEAGKIKEMEAVQQATEGVEEKVEKSEQEIRVAQQAIEEDKRKMEEAAREDEYRHTTFREFLDIHHRVFVERDLEGRYNDYGRSYPSTPTTEKCPIKLRPWKDFLETQQQIFRRVYLLLQQSSPQGGVFYSRRFVKDLDRYTYLTTSLIQSPEWALARPLSVITSRLREHDALLATVMSTEVHEGQTLCDQNSEVKERLGNISSPNRIGVYAETPGGEDEDKKERRLLFFQDTKSRHHLTTAMLRTGLRSIDRLDEIMKRERFMDAVDGDVDLYDRFAYHADRLVGVVICQAYTAMIDAGLEYGSISNGEASVFLWINPGDPTTVHYFLSEPNRDVPPRKADGDDDDDEGWKNLYQTALAQLLAFRLRALDSTPQSQKWRRQQHQELQTCSVDFNSVLDKVPREDLRRLTPPPQRPSTLLPAEEEIKGLATVMVNDVRPDEADNSKMLTPNGHDVRNDGNNDINGNKIHHDQNPSSLSDAEKDYSIDSPTQTPATNGLKKDMNDEGQGPKQDQGIEITQEASAERPTITTATKKTTTTTTITTTTTTTTTAVATDGSKDSRPYCTQTCLLNMLYGSELDHGCPNVSLHPQVGANRHALNGGIGTFASLVKNQLDQDADHDCKPLHRQGGRGSLFKITLSTHGYTFVAKGTVKAFVTDIRREGRIYQTHLGSLQGYHVPVYLGNIELAQPYYLDTNVRIVHMMLLSWVGKEDLRTPGSQEVVSDLRSQIKATRKLVLKNGVHHGMSTRNMVWNVERQVVMFVDFEKADTEYREVDVETNVVSPIDSATTLTISRAKDTYTMAGSSTRTSTLKTVINVSTKRSGEEIDGNLARKPSISLD